MSCWINPNDCGHPEPASRDADVVGSIVRKNRLMQMNKTRLVLALLLITLGLCRQASAQLAGESPGTAELPNAIDLPGLLRIVREVSPRLAPERQGIASAQADKIIAAAYPNPNISVGTAHQGGRQTSFDGRRQNEFQIDQPILLPGQRAARVEKVEREIQAARARVASGTSSLAGEASLGYISLLSAQEKTILQISALRELSRLRDIVAGRADVGMASRYDLARLDVELASASTKLEEFKAEVADRSGGLASLLGLRGWQPRATDVYGPLKMDVKALANSTTLIDRANASPAVQLATEEERVAQSGVALAKRERWPVPVLNLGRSWSTTPYGAANAMGLSVEVPLLDDRRGPVIKAEVDAKRAALQRELALSAVAATLQRQALVIAARQAALERFETDAAARLASLKEMAEHAYRLGKGTIFELLDSTRSRGELLEKRVDLVAALLEAQILYLTASGELTATP